jgi:DNA-binding response OmpR family regulator
MLKFSSDAEQFVLDFDKEKLQTIVVNLVSNAIKFTPEGGKVAVYLECGGQFRLVVRDTGIGISPEALPFIFDRFYQAEDAARKDVGVGIGLALAKELVELMGGKIGVESEAGRGAVFTVTFPIRRTAPFEEVHVPAVPAAGSKAAFPENHPPSRNKISILIIEDHPEAARYVASCLGSKFRVLFASDGARGLKLAFETVPDLIICDVMMPEKDGYEVCKILKCDERTSHIPLIMLTAKADAGSRLDGLGSGADAYLLKPFDETELRLRVEKLLELRRRLQARFHNPAECPPAGQTSSRESAFLQKIRDVTEARLTDHDFTVEALARAVGMSLPQLHRKITALTGHSTKRFIRSVRLQKARELLRATDLNISEIAYECGFGSPSHFARAFKEAFGVSPMEWRGSLPK